MIRFRLGHLYNAEWLYYLNFVVSGIKEGPADQVGLSGLLPLLEDVALQAAQAIEVIRGSQLTQNLDDLDANRDRCIAGVNSYLRFCELSENAELARAARLLLRVADHYAGMADENREQESIRITSFVAELTKPEHTPALTLLDGQDLRLSELLRVLTQANDEYIALQNTRTSAEAQRPTLRMAEVRRQGDPLLRTVLDLTDAQQRANPSPAIQQLAAKLNAQNQLERTKLATRKTRRGVDKTPVGENK
jgi:hypothetical protein